MSKYNKRTDSNHAAFIRTLTGCGYRVIDTHSLPGCLDILALSKSNRLYLIEIKPPVNPSPLTAAELATLAEFSPAAFVADDPMAAIAKMDEMDRLR